MNAPLRGDSFRIWRFERSAVLQRGIFADEIVPG